jgi:hypothetical protein
MGLMYIWTKIIGLITWDFRHSIVIGLSKKSIRLKTTMGRRISDCLNFELEYVHNWLFLVTTCFFSYYTGFLCSQNQCCGSEIIFSDPDPALGLILDPDPACLTKVIRLYKIRL